MVLTIAFILLSSVLIYVPSIAYFRLQYLNTKIAGAQIASLAVEAAQDNTVPVYLEAELLTNADVLAVALRRDSVRYLMLAGDLPATIDAHFDLRNVGPVDAIIDAFSALWAGDKRNIRVMNAPAHGGGDIIDIVLREAPLRAAMIEYSWNVAGLSLLLSLFTAALIYCTLHYMLVRPIRILTASMVGFRNHPEDIRREIKPSKRHDEIGVAERELSGMQIAVRQSLKQKARLAELGTAVSKINHDLRNILANVQMASDRLLTVDDPFVRRLTPALISSVGRAIDLCTDTLTYGGAREKPPRRLLFELSPLIDEIGASICSTHHAPIQFHNGVPADLQIDADPDQIFRVIQNLGRNAVQAMDSGGTLRIEAQRVGPLVTIDVLDNGPGFSPLAREHLFEPFAPGASHGGSGLGLSISRDLTRAHGGDLHLLRTGPDGTAIRIEIPDSSLSQHGYVTLRSKG
ncbi:MAG: sensor histidine kinase [Pseudomonadota bacterium]